MYIHINILLLYNIFTKIVIKESEEVISSLKKLNRDVNITVIKGEELKNLGFGGVYGVGKGSKFPPALIILQYIKDKSFKSVAWVGKGITFDTGKLKIAIYQTMYIFYCKNKKTYL